MLIYRTTSVIAVLTLTGFASTGYAESLSSQAGLDQARSTYVSSEQRTPSQKSSADGFGSAINDGVLREVTGREDTGTMVASSTQRNTVANNSVTGNSVTGEVHIDGNAFQNLQGLAVISANSGNNVAINSSMNVTVNLAPK